MDPAAIGEPLGPWDPRTLGSYDIRRRLGRGGQGVVYLAESGEHGLVAIKLLGGDAPGAVSPDVARRFAREADAAMAVAQFCTARVLSVGDDQGRPYLVSEYVPGPSLQALVAERGPRTGSDLDRIAVATATALVAIHEAGVVHRDFKPANVIMGPDGPRVIDFGIARAVGPDVATTAVVGTPAYMSPELLHGASPTSAVDVFAWAGTLVFVATGRPPFGADAMTSHRVLHEPPNLDGVPERLLPLVRDCLDKDPSRRPAAQDLLLRLLTGRASGTVPPQPTASQMLGLGADLAASPLQSGDQNPAVAPGPSPGASAPGVEPGFPSNPPSGPGFPSNAPAAHHGYPAHATQPPGTATPPPGSGAPHTLPGPPAPKRRLGTVIGVAAGVAAGLLVAGGAAYAFWPDGKPSGPVAVTSPPSASAPTTPPTTAPSTSSAPTATGKTSSPTSSPSETKSPPKKTTGGWSAPSAASGISATGTYDTRGGRFSGDVVLRMSASKGFAVFEHQHFNGATMCDYGVELAKPGETHNATFDSKCTGSFRVRTCLASKVTGSDSAPDITYDRCTPWHAVF
ncbi:serine/threonine protein kinase [Actinomadura rupiterrae]|uniref:serine/threonine protein kinase n=1 Tax=Actinomadura rupiterrae TaxID=559627 RepID=UPI0020A50C08|nr:serine/threonine-protein kinase [Actinomadura rupiterrae]MCP2340529.1 serine/threonine protein kinase [Actinomadura rupiterrae]